LIFHLVFAVIIREFSKIEILEIFLKHRTGLKNYNQDISVNFNLESHFLNFRLLLLELDIFIGRLNEEEDPKVGNAGQVVSGVPIREW